MPMLNPVDDTANDQGSPVDSIAAIETLPDSGAVDMRCEPSLLLVQGLDAGYDETQVLWDVSLDIRRGEVVALVGANGAGKSTLLSALSGLVRPWKGTITFAGRDITFARAERIVKVGLAHVPQGRRLFGGLSVEENLLLGAYTKRADSTRSIAADLERVFTLLPRLQSD